MTEATVFTLEQKQAFLVAMYRIAKEGPVHEECLGICYNVGMEVCDILGSWFPVDDFYQWLSENAVDWPHHTGDDSFPVPHVGPSKWEDDQGALRYNLLDYLINKLSDELVNEQGE